MDWKATPCSRDERIFGAGYGKHHLSDPESLLGRGSFRVRLPGKAWGKPFGQSVPTGRRNGRESMIPVCCMASTTGVSSYHGLSGTYCYPQASTYSHTLDSSSIQAFRLGMIPSLPDKGFLHAHAQTSGMCEHGFIHKLSDLDPYFLIQGEFKGMLHPVFEFIASCCRNSGAACTCAYSRTDGSAFPSSCNRANNRADS